MIFDPGNKVLLPLPRWLGQRLEREAMSLGMNPAVVVYAMLERMTEAGWQHVFAHKNRYVNLYSRHGKQQ